MSIKRTLAALAVGLALTLGATASTGVFHDMTPQATVFHDM